MNVPRAIVSALAAVAVATVTAPALATDIQACLAASERGQRSRAAGKLREAREQFMICAEGCPTLVRQDCAQWSTELSRLVPSVVFGARDKQGRDLFDVIVSMDGEVLLQKLDGKSVSVDPGKHAFRFEVQGLAPVTETVLVKEGERARAIDVTFEPAGRDPGRTTAPPPNLDTPPLTTTPEAMVSGHTPYPWIVFGVGIATMAVGGIVYASSPELPAGCDETRRQCTQEPGESSESFQNRQEEAGKSDSQPALGLVVMGAGAVVVAGGLVWHFLEPKRVKKTGLSVSPWTTGHASGVGFGGQF